MKSNLKFDSENKIVDIQKANEETKIIHLNLFEDGIPMSSVFELQSLIFLDSSKIIGDIDKIIHFDDKFYILDKSKAEKVYCFDEHGKFLCNFGRKGRGPSEYLALYDFTIDQCNRELLVYDGKKILYYDLNGCFIKQRKIDLFGKNLCVIDSTGTILINQGNTIFNKDLMFNLIAIDSYNYIKYMLRPFKEIDTKKKLMPWSYFSQNNNDIYYIEPYNDTIYKIIKNAITPKYIMNYQKYSTPYNLREKTARGERKENQEEMNHMTAVIQNDSTIFILNSKKGRFVFTFYDKNSGLSRSIINVVDDLITPSVTLLPKGSYTDKYFIVVLDPYLVHNDYKNLTENLSRDEKEKVIHLKELNNMRQILNKTNENSNQILAILKVKRKFYEN